MHMIDSISLSAVNAPFSEPNSGGRKSNVCGFKWEIGNFYCFSLIVWICLFSAAFN